MRYLIIVKASPESEAAITPDPDPALLAEMAAYHEDLARAGVLLDGAGLKPSREGWRIRFEGSTRTVAHGPFALDENLMAGYTLIQARSAEEALEWTRRYPNPRGPGLACHIEVRPLYALDDFPPGEAVERFREIPSAQ